MATFKATSKKKDKGVGVFKATENKSYEASFVMRLEDESKESSSILNDYVTRRKNDEWIGEDDISDYRSALDRYKSSYSSLADIQRSYGNFNEDDDKKWNEWVSTLSSDLDSSSELFGNYNTNNEYKAAMQALEEHEELKTANLDDLHAEKERLQKFVDAIASEKASLNKLKSRAETLRVSSIFGGKDIKEEYEYVKRQIKATEENLAEAEKEGYDTQLSNATSRYNRAKHIQNGIKLESDALNAKDFEEKSKYVSTKSDSRYAVATSQYGMGYDDLTYEYINNVDGMRDKIEHMRDVYHSDSPFDDGTSTFEEKSYNYINDDEKKIYNYYYATEGAEKAQEYLDSIQETLASRQAESIRKHAEDNLFLQYVFGAYAGLDQFSSGITNLITQPEGYVPTNAVQQASALIRHDLYDSGFKIGETSLGQIGYDLTTTTANMAPSLIAGGLSNLVAPGAGTYVTPTLLGASASGNAYAEAINLGYDKSQARTYATIVGVSEAGLQYLLGGIGKAGGKLSNNAIKKVISGIDNGFARFSLDFGGRLASEGLEEGLQEVLNPFFENIAFQMDNDLGDVDWSQVAYSALLGSLSAFGLEGVPTAAKHIKYNNALKAEGKKIADNGATDTLLALANELTGVKGGVEGKNLSKRVSKVNGKKGVNVKALGVVSQGVNAIRMEQNKADLTKDLMAKGVSESKASKYADILFEMNEEFYKGDASSFTLGTDKQWKKITGDENAYSILRKVVTDKDSSVNVRNLKHLLARGGITQAEDGNYEVSEQRAKVIKKAMADEAYTQSAKDVANVKPNVAEDGKTKDATTGAEITIKGVDHIEVEKDNEGNVTDRIGYFKVVDSEGNESVVSARDVEYGKNSEGLIYESFIAMDVDPAYFDTYVKGFNANDFKTAEGKVADDAVTQYALGFQNAYRYGWVGIEGELDASTFASKLNPTARKAAYDAGVNARQYDVDTKQGALDTAVEERKASGKGKARTQGKLHMEGVKTTKGLTAMQNAGVGLAKRLLSLGVDVYIYESHQDANGNWVDDRGEPADNGFYRLSDGSIHIDLNAGENGKGIMVYTLSHELVHWMRPNAEREFKIFADLLIKWYGKKGMSVSEQITEIMHEDGLGWDDAYEELVARSCESFLTDSNVADRIIEVKQTDKKTWEVIRDKVLSFLKWMKSLFEGHSPETAEGQFFHELKGEIDELYDAFYNTLASASETFQWIGAGEVTTDTVTNFAKKNDGRQYDKLLSMETADKIAGVKKSSRIDAKSDSQIIAKEFNTYISNLKAERKADGKTMEARDVINYIKRHPELDFVHRISNKDRSVTADLTEFVNGINDVKLLESLSWHIGTAYYDANAVRDGYGYARSYAESIRTFRNAIRERIDEITTENVDGTNLGVKDGEVKLTGVKDIFYKMNSNEEIGEFAKKVFATVEKLGVNIRFTEQTLLRNVVGDSLGDMVEYKTSYLNDTSVSDQHKASTILHELIHTCTAYVMLADQGKAITDKRVKRAVDGLNEIYESLKGDRELRDQYGLENPREMVAELSNEEFVGLLKKKNLWDRVLDFICDLFGFTRGTNAYSNARMCVDFILDSPDVSAYKEYALENRLDAKRGGYDVFGKTVSEDGIRYSKRQKAPTFYSYNDFVSKPDMLITTVTGNVPTNRADIVAVAKRNAVKVGKTNKDGSVSVHVNDIDADVVLTTHGLRHGLRRKQQMTKANGIVTLMAGQIIQNSIQVNELVPADDDVSGTYILLGIAQDTNGDVYVVRSVVNRYDNELVSMDALYAVNAKKELAVQNAPRLTAKPLSVTSSTISIADLLDYVNRYFPDILPEDVLKHYGHTERPDGDLGESVLYSRRGTGTSNRSLLANAFESAIQTEDEARRLAEYREKIDLINAEEQKLRETRARIAELSFAKGPKDTVTIKNLQATATRIANRINTYDKQLLRLEATAPLKALLEREKDAVRKREKQKAAQALAEYREKSTKTLREVMNRNAEARKKNVDSRKRTVVRNKIKRVVTDLNGLLNRGTKERNVKTDMQETVGSALKLASVIFNDDITNEDIVLMGSTMATEEEQKLLDQYVDLIEKRDSSQFDEAMGYINKISNLDRKLADLFKRERARLNQAKISEAVDELAKAYAGLQGADKDYVNFAYNEEVHKRLMSLSKTLGGTIATDMSLDQLNEVYDAYKMILHMVRESNSLFRMGKTEDLAKRVTTVQEQILSLFKEREKDPRAFAKKVGDLFKSFKWNEMKPLTAFETLGAEAYTELFWDAIKAEGEWAKWMQEANAFLTEQRDECGYKSWDMESAYEFTLPDGKAFRLTLQDMMSIYAYSKRDQAQEHMTVGGFQFDKNNAYKDKSGKKRVRLGDLYVTDWTTISNIISELADMYDGKVKAYVDAVQKYLTDMGQRGNEVSEILYGIGIFNEAAYFPLMSSKDYRSSVEEALNKTQTMVSLKNTGMTKPTVPHANNPIILQGFDDVVVGHIDKMAKYCTHVLAIENLRRVFDSVSADDGGDYVSTKAVIEKVFGESAKKYFDQYITDLNGGVFMDGAESPTMAMFSKFKGTAVGASLSVIVQQPMAVVRAMDVIDPKHFVLGDAGKAETEHLYDEIKKYAPVAIIKEIGGFDVGSSRTAREYLGERTDKGLKRAVDEVNDKAMIGAAKADELGWGIIWKAVKREVAFKGEFKPGTAEFLEACGERFTEVIVRTQVYDSVNSRSGYMRSKHELVKFATSFMGEPTTVINEAYLAILNVGRAKSKPEKAKALKKLGRTMGVLMTSTLLTTIAKSFIYGLRDDDDDEALLERWAKHTGENLGLWGDLNPLTMLPFARDIVSLFEGWDVERPDMTLIANIINSAGKLFKEDASVDDVLTFIGDTGNLFGIPVKNIIRDSKGIIGFFGDIFDDIAPTNMGGAFVRGITGEEQSNTEALYDAIMSGDEGKQDVIEDKYKNESTYETAVKKALRENDPRIREALKIRVNGGFTDKYSRIRQEIINEGNFGQGIVDEAMEAEYNYFMGKIEEAADLLKIGDKEASDDIIRNLKKKYKGTFTQDDILKAAKRRAGLLK